MKATEKKSLDSLLATLSWIMAIWRTRISFDCHSDDFALWQLDHDVLEELAGKLGGPRTREMLGGRVSPARRAARRRLLEAKLTYPAATGRGQYAVKHRGLYDSLVRGGFETVKDVVSVSPSEFYRLGNFGNRRRVELKLLLVDLLRQDLRFDHRVRDYHIGVEPEEVTREQLEPLERRAREIARQWKQLREDYDELYKDSDWHHCRVKKVQLRRYPVRSDELPSV